MRIDHGLLPGHVLQRSARGAAASVAGACAIDGVVTATVRKGTRTLPGFAAVRAGRAAAGRFTARLRGLPTGGPYRVEFACGNEVAAVDEVFVGDLWLMAGQSNMEGIGNLQDRPAPHPLVRLFSMGRVWAQAEDPLHALLESPDFVHGGLAMPRAQAVAALLRKGKGAGVGVHFGTAMHERTGVPQGLIAAAHGGTAMREWDPALKERGGESLYGSLWLSLQAVAQPIAGVLWYQGCSDASEADAPLYTARMQALIAALRRDLGQPRLPWVIAQIGRFVDGREARTWNAVQEQQRLLPALIPACDVVPSVDLELDDHIHVSARSFALLGERMARIAARLALGERSEKPAIQPRSATLVEQPAGLGMAVDVRFANAVGGLAADGPARGFDLVDREQRPLHLVYRVELLGDRARLHVRDPGPAGTAVMYGAGTNPVCTLRDGRGMAVPVFGPLAISGGPAVGAWALRWRVAPIRPGEDIAGLARPDAADAQAQERRFPGPFVNLHPEWEGHGGHVGFTGEVAADEAMEAELRFGYDGPVRLWLGGAEVFTDLHGINPAIQDDRRVRVRLAKGVTPLAVLMATNGGRAWGFFLRFGRPGASLADAPAMPRPWA